jgi:hypothetical protein
MRRHIRRGIVLGIIGIAAAGALLVSGRPAEAGSCAAGATCTFELTNTNVTDVTVDIRVTVNNSGSSTVLTFAFISDNITNTPLGIDQFGYNSAVAGVSPLPGGWTQAANCPCNQDGFGKFASEIDKPASTALSFTFTLQGLVTTFADNANGGEFAAHIRYDGNCSAFVSDGTSSGTTPDSNCHGVPEPASMLLLTTGLVSTAGLLGTRLRSRRTVAVA